MLFNTFGNRENPVIIMLAGSFCSAESMAVYYGSSPYRRTLTNHNKLLSMYEGAFGIKTGFTKKSGRCLVSAVKRDGKTPLILVTNDLQRSSEEIAELQNLINKADDTAVSA